MEYHRIEKGLSLKETRPGFGKPIVADLIKKLARYIDSYGIDQHVGAAINALRHYSEFNKLHNAEDECIDREIESLAKRLDQCDTVECHGGVIELSREEVKRDSEIDLAQFFASRHSIRNFSAEPVPRDFIERAVKMAQKTPSVCNRQAWRVYCFHDDENKRRVLSHQNGNRGFGHLASWVLVVTCDLRHFVSVGERNQAWIDGGMFAMSLLYALHSLGLGACPLNWSMRKEADRALRKSAGIDEHDAVIMLMAVGHLPEQFCVARAVRKPLREVMIERDSGAHSAHSNGNRNRSLPAAETESDVYDPVSVVH